MEFQHIRSCFGLFFAIIKLERLGNDIAKKVEYYMTISQLKTVFIRMAQEYQGRFSGSVDW